MDIKDIKPIYDFLKDTDITELELEDERGKLRIKRGTASLGPVAGAYAVPSVVAQPAARGGSDTAGAQAPSTQNYKVVTAPMVGTFYRSPSPEANAFVDIGSTVKKGQVVCIVEAMKIMNDVESEFSGKIVDILVENGQPVEYGEPLFHIEA